MRFVYKNPEQLKGRISELNLEMRLSDDTSVLFTPSSVNGTVVRNRFVFQPMEGCDSTDDGSPSDMTVARYVRYAAGGAGIIWIEAVSISEDGRANSRQLYINENNVDSFKMLADSIRATSLSVNGFAPIIIIQLTHSGRYSKPGGIAKPVIAYNNPLFEKDAPLDQSAIISDDALKALEEEFAAASLLVKKAGFDGVDIKCCHRYLASELMSAYERPGEYGGSFANRIRFFVNTVAGASTLKDSSFFVTTRLNAFDGFPYPYGFGVNSATGLIPDYSEPLELCRILNTKYDMELINITIGNPYMNPHVNRPYDSGGYSPSESPLIGVDRILGAASVIAHGIPDMKVVCTGLSYLRQFGPSVAAALISGGGSTFAGFGRMALANPDFIGELRRTGTLSAGSVCTTCSKCTMLMRAGCAAGCVVRGPEIYTKLYMENCRH